MAVSVEEDISSGSVTDELVNENDHENADDEIGGIRIGDIYVPPPPPPALTFDCTGPRLIITHIENNNFKSYAGKQVLGPFHKNFTSIVGPNGSGKSNVIDSMLFVFGYRAQKIRSKKISVLIHSSSKFPNIENCTVTVHFSKIIDKDADEFDLVPNSAFQVSRTAHRDNSSWYSINNKRVQFKEVSKLLRSYGIDLDHNRFLILQGEVEQIAMMKPKAQTEHDSGMLEFLEDIIGCERFKLPIEQLSKQVEELNEKRAEKVNRIKVVEKEKDELEGPKNEALEYLKKANEIILEKNILCQKDISETELKKASAIKEQEVVKVQMDEINNQLEVLKKETTENRKDATKKQKLIADYEKHCDKKKEEFREMERKDVELRNNLSHSKTKLKKGKKSLETENQNLRKYKEQPADSEAKTAELITLRDKLETELRKEEEKLSIVMGTLKDETKTLQEEKDVYEGELIGLKKVVDETKSRLDVVQAEKDVYLSTEVKEKEKLAEMKNNLGVIKTTLAEKESAFVRAEKALPEYRERMKKGKVDMAEFTKRENNLNEKICANRLRVETARSSMQDSRKRNRVQTVIMEQKENGNLKGILGRLGDLGAIDEKYDVAISTACGALDNIVTETIEDAQRCVQFLKDNSVGVATFIALDKMQRWLPNTQRRVETPENVPRLFDLVKVEDERILPAFYFALKETLVADNLEQATRIGLQGRTRYRVVTIKGELIDISGTMSGGGNRVSSGRMGSTVVVGRDAQSNEMPAAEMAIIENEIATSSGELLEVRNRKMALEEDLRQLQKDIESLVQNTQKGAQDIERLKEQIRILSAQIEEQDILVIASASDQAKVKELQKTVDSCSKAYEKASEEARKIEVKVTRVNDLIKEVTGKKVESVQKKVNELKTKMAAVQTNITKTGVESKTATRNAKKCEEKIENLNTEILETTELIGKLKKEMEEMAVDAGLVMTALKMHEDEKELVVAQFNEIQNQLKELKAKEKKFLEDNIDIKSAFEKHSSDVSDYTNRIQAIEHQLEKLVLHNLGDETEPNILHKLTSEELEQLDIVALKYALQVKEEVHKKLRPNMASIDEYKRKEQQYLQRVSDLEAVTSERDIKKNHHDQFRKQRLNEFMGGFSIITTKLKEVYQMLTLGGDAELELLDSMDPFSEGIVFSVRPPKKSWKNISNLSGGEKTLSSLALVMALHYYRPTPLYVMDEIDAALDFRNVSIVGHYIKERTKNAQFIVISLRNNMFELADRLVGIYKTYDCTKSVTINPNNFKTAEQT